MQFCKVLSQLSHLFFHMVVSCSSFFIFLLILSISDLNCSNTWLLFLSVFWNSSYFCVYVLSWVRSCFSASWWNSHFLINSPAWFSNFKTKNKIRWRLFKLRIFQINLPVFSPSCCVLRTRPNGVHFVGVWHRLVRSRGLCVWVFSRYALVKLGKQIKSL